MNGENQIQEVVLNDLMKEYKQVRDDMMSEVRALDDAIATLQEERGIRVAPFEKSLEVLEAKIWLPLQDWATAQEAKKAGKTFICPAGKITHFRASLRIAYDADALDKICSANQGVKDVIYPFRSEKPVEARMQIKVSSE